MNLIDTDVIVDVQRGYPPAIAWFAGLNEIPMAPGIVVMELIQSARNAHEVRQAMKLVAPVPVVWSTESDCTVALTDFATYHLSHGLGLLDALIAACTKGLAATLLTFNTKHYHMIPGLLIAEPYAR